MKSFTLISFTFFLSPVFLLTAQAFQCYRCGGDPTGPGNDSRYGDPCPGIFSDDPKYIVDCPVPTWSNGRNSCTKERIHHVFVGGTKVIEYRECYEYREKIKDKHPDCGGHRCGCSTENCDCFETLCNGEKLDELIQKGETPYNPYSTTSTTTTTDEPSAFSKAQDKSKQGGVKLLWLFLFLGQVISFPIKIM